MAMSFDLKKPIEPGSWRWIGQRMAGMTSTDVPIGGCSIRAIARHLGGTAHRIGKKILPANAFVVERGPLRLLYVRPDYRGYRRAAGRVFADTPWKVDCDHALGSKLAISFGVAYVLLIRIVPGVNRAHGWLERPQPFTGLNSHKLCFADDRILDKWLGRRPGSRRSPALLPRYRPGSVTKIGLTLKQAGQWGYAMGVEDFSAPVRGLSILHLR